MQIYRKLTSGDDPTTPKRLGVVYPVHTRSDAPKSILVRLWRYWRRSVRRYRECREVTRLLKVIRDQDARVLLDLQTKDDALKAAEERYNELVDKRIPKLQRELEVEKAYSESLATMLEKIRSQYEADISANNYRVAVGKMNEHEAKRIGRDDD